MTHLTARSALGFLPVVLLAALLLSQAAASPARAAEARQSYLWLNSGRAELEGWQRQGVTLAGDVLRLDPAGLKTGRDPYPAGAYHGGNYYNGGSFFYGEALAPYYSPPGGFDNAVVSWNASTPPGSWVELHIRALVGGSWTREYVMGIWSSDNGAVRRHSVGGQSDGKGRVETDTLCLNARATAFQVRALLYSTSERVSPEVSLVAVSAVRNGDFPSVSSNRAAWGQDLAVPERSQMIYPDGGEVWCSPTSTSMVLAYWAGKTGRAGLNQTVPAAAAQTYDWIYRGNGNWPFNTAWAASLGSAVGLQAYLTRFNSLTQIESWIVLGVPVIASVAFRPGQLSGAPLNSTDGHILVVRGFDGNGNVIVNDPAADPRRGEKIRLVYQRAQFEQRWLEGSGGAVYILRPAGVRPPIPRQTAWAALPEDRQNYFADPALETLWKSADQPVAAGSAQRSWLWGPGPLSTARLESYVEGPHGERLVQYFDKSRMEITRPQGDRAGAWFVTNGLLTVEMVSGRQQMGDNSFRTVAPADIPVAGDPTSQQAPTYATFRPLASVDGQQTARRAPDRVGQAVTASLSRSGNQGQRDAGGVKIAAYEATLGHNIPDVFWNWMNDPARSGLANGWLFALGYPITEPYWVEVNLQGKPATVLVQLFERRALTYAPGNPAAFKVEMGNIGQHYLAWRY